MNDINQLTQRILDFINDRDWNQFHNPKDLALSLVLESAEVMEHFQWQSNEEMQEYIKSHKDEVGEELADVFYWILLMSHKLDIDIIEAFKNKMLKNEAKYPVDKAKGKHDKYNKL
ncbi:MAG: nucleotide pyrophosphohydrolase [Clostridia bacterium]|jgi:NTP pyrophosphatase (non-canonical NTP hydrolase)|nr:nucleotide pyrophosphohydrolase [Clostridia bacterium]